VLDFKGNLKQSTLAREKSKWAMKISDQILTQKRALIQAFQAVNPIFPMSATLISP
jgi:hypothetical protein